MQVQFGETVDGKNLITENNSGITRDSLEVYELYKKALGSILSVTITESEQCEWETRVEGKEADMLLYGFSFGYGGEGPRGLLTLLDDAKLDVSDEAKAQVLGITHEYDENSQPVKSMQFFYEDSQVKLTTTGRDGFKRTAIQLTTRGGNGGSHSIDVLGLDGELVCTLNIAHNGQDTRWANVDVCFKEAGRKGKALAWADGNQVLDWEANGSSLVAVELTR